MTGQMNRAQLFTGSAKMSIVIFLLGVSIQILFISPIPVKIR